MPKGSQSRPGAVGRLSHRPPPDEGLVPKTVDFIKRKLPAWRDDPRRPITLSEKSLNSSLCDYLASQARSELPMVNFKHEAPQASGRTVDLAVQGTEEMTLIGSYIYTIYDPFFVIEAKRLPAPRRDREREYLTGTDRTSGSATGGIQRFKLGLHGALVESAAIIGYVQSETTNHWFTTINNWIEDLIVSEAGTDCVWTESEKIDQLICNNVQNTAFALSTHSRDKKCRTPTIKIHHLWIVFATRSK